MMVMFVFYGSTQMQLRAKRQHGLCICGVTESDVILDIIAGIVRVSCVWLEKSIGFCSPSRRMADNGPASMHREAAHGSSVPGNSTSQLMLYKGILSHMGKALCLSCLLPDFALIRGRLHSLTVNAYLTAQSNSGLQ